jgi:cytochrome c5
MRSCSINKILKAKFQINTILFLLCMSFIGASNAQTISSSSNQSSKPREFLNKYCIVCHNETLKTANLMLDRANVDNINEAPALWEKVVTKLTLRAMPQVGFPMRPSETEYKDMLAYLTGGLDTLASNNLNPGRPTIHRLNRTEYANSIRDLLVLDIDPADYLPPDNVAEGFDNIAHVLSVSPLLMEQYVLAASKISRLAVGLSNMLPVSETYEISEDFLQKNRMSDDLPFGSRGGIAIKHYFPMSGEYNLRIKLSRNGEGYIRGMRYENLVDVRVDHERLNLFKVGGEVYGKSGPLFTHSQNPDFAGDTDQIGYEFSADKDMEVTFSVEAGEHLVAVTFMDNRAKKTGYLSPDLMVLNIANYKGGEAMLDSVVITGPFGETETGSTPSRENIFICEPGMASRQDACANQIITNIAHRAFRRPVKDAEMEDLMSIYRQGSSEAGFERGIELALQRILAGPEFLFRIEQEPENAKPGTVYPILDLDLATRLSFFLWSSIPDDELLSIAERKELRKPGVLEQQVNRMLASSKAETFISNFGEQWLALRKIDLAAPQKAVFPSFDGELRDAMKKELSTWFEYMVKNDKSVLDMLDADYTFVNERLAKHYGIENVYGEKFRKVEINHPERAGLLGKPGLLMVTSFNSRTSPVVRGKWVLENVVDMAPPPPPADAFQPELQVQNKEGKALTMKEAMIAHRQNPVCANCHKMMEPIGLALENFDGIGSYRTEYDEANAIVDSSGILFDNSEFADANGFRNQMLKYSDRFVHTVVTKLMTYALGRKVEYYDQPVIRDIIEKTESKDYTWSSLILGVIESIPFQYRRTPL